MAVMATPKKNPWGARLRKLRAARGLTQEGAAKYLEVPLSTLRNWEQGRTAPPPFARRLIERALKEAKG